MGNSPKTTSRYYRTKVIPVANGVDVATSNSAELGFQFYNYIHRPVTVLTRTGLRIIIPYRPLGRTPKPMKKPSGLVDEPCFIIRVKVQCSPDVILDTTELSNDCGLVTSAEAKAYLDSIQLAEDKFARGSRQSAWVEYHIPASDFDKDGGILFLQNLDLQVSILDQASTAPHPFSLLGQRNRDAYEFKDQLAPLGVFYGVYIRDRDGQYGSRFINVNGAVHSVEALRDESTERDGVYVITCKRATSSFVPQRVFTEYYTFEEADEKLGLYQTYRDAASLGDPQERYKREHETQTQTLKNQELDFKKERLRVEQEWERTRDSMRREMMNYEHQLRRVDQLNKLIAAELEQRDQIYRREMMILKEVLDARGHERREVTELIKMIPTVITTVATWVVAIKKLKTL